MFYDNTLYYNLAEIFAPMQIMMVLVLALIVFGPKRLPELGKQIGTALRELNKAKSDMLKHLNVDHEPEPEPYNYAYPTEHQSAYSTTVTHEPPDLSAYTIAGQPPVVKPAVDTVSHGYGSYDPSSSADYTLVSPSAPTAHAAPSAPAATASTDNHKEGEHNV
jgi:sec-independent protein translocase protein TatA